jgi:hypothetical protein
MRPISFLLFLLAILPMTVTSVSASDAPLPLRPSSKWQIDYAPDYCRLTRSFGTGDDAITLVMDRFGPSDHLRLTLAGKPMRAKNDRMQAQLRFGADAKPMQLDFFRGSSNGEPAWLAHHLLWVEADNAARTPADVAAAEAKIGEIFIGSPLGQPVILETGSFAAPFAALRKCTNELLTDWGLDAARHDGLRQYAMPSGNAATWLKDSDYPAGMARFGQQAIVDFRLIVGADGNAETCHVQLSTDTGFNDVVCGTVMKRAKFSPALDRDGVPIRSFYRNVAVFKIPTDPCDRDRSSVRCAKK